MGNLPTTISSMYPAEIANSSVRLSLGLKPLLVCVQLGEYNNLECDSLNPHCLLYTSDAADEEDSVDL
eukprot:1341354-Amorphochlora_amoeboformis.AAC.1